MHQLKPQEAVSTILGVLSCAAPLYQGNLLRVASTTEKSAGYQVSCYSYKRGSQVGESTFYDLWQT